jgi:hypothetical protein
MKKVLLLLFVSIVNYQLSINHCFAQQSTLEWAFGFGTKKSMPYSVKTDDNNNIYVLGKFFDETDFDPTENKYTLTSDYYKGSTFVAKYTPAGKLLWAKQITTNLEGRATAKGDYALMETTDNGVFITGSFAGTVDFNPSPTATNYLDAQGETALFLLQLDSVGNFLSADQIGSENWYFLEPFDYFPDGSWISAWSFIYEIKIQYENQPKTLTPQYFDFALCKLDKTNNIIWINQFGANGNDNAHSVAIDQNTNEFIVTGSFGETMDFDPGSAVNELNPQTGRIFFAKYNADGNLLWAKNIGGKGIDNARKVVVNTDGEIFLAGWFQGAADFDPSSKAFILNSDTKSEYYTDLFVAKYDKNGNFLWAQKAGGAENEEAWSMDLDNEGNIILCGVYAGKADFDPTAKVYELNTIIPYEQDSYQTSMFLLKLKQ